MRTPAETEAIHARADAGMNQAASHANAKVAGWSDQAYAMLRRYSWENPKFLAEEFVAYAIKHGLAEPPDRRAFGAVLAKASRNRDIKREGFAVDNYASPKAVWVLVDEL